MKKCSSEMHQFELTDPVKFPAIELSKDAIWASQIMQKLAMQNLSRLVMDA